MLEIIIKYFLELIKLGDLILVFQFQDFDFMFFFQLIRNNDVFNLINLVVDRFIFFSYGLGGKLRIGNIR